MERVERIVHRHRRRHGIQSGCCSTSTSTCCFWMACTSSDPMAQPGFAGSRHRPARNSPNWRTPSLTGSAVFWNGKAYWSGMPRTVTGLGCGRRRPDRSTAGVIRSRTALRWGHRQGAKYSPCKRCRPVMSRSMTGWARWLASRCTPGWRPGPMNARSWNGCAGTSAARRFRKSGCRSRRTATCATS